MPGARPAVLLAVLAAVMAAGCGGDGDKPAASSPQAGGTERQGAVPGTASAADAALIARWAAAIRDGDIAKATSYFRIPAIVSNSGPPMRLESAEEIAFFNITLPCGARLVRTAKAGKYVIATFVLTERVRVGGPGRCDGTGARAYTAFRIVGGKIAEWRRVSSPTEAPGRGAPDLRPAPQAQEV